MHFKAALRAFQIGFTERGRTVGYTYSYSNDYAWSDGTEVDYTDWAAWSRERGGISYVVYFAKLGGVFKF